MQDLYVLPSDLLVRFRLIVFVILKTLSAAIKSVEDHGYILDLGIPDVSGFLSFKDATKGPIDKKAKLHVGQLLDVSVKTMSSNRRTCNVSADVDTFSSSSVS
jgi:rRNA biogenesis protein RRP5